MFIFALWVHEFVSINGIHSVIFGEWDWRRQTCWNLDAFFVSFKNENNIVVITPRRHTHSKSFYFCFCFMEFGWDPSGLTAMRILRARYYFMAEEKRDNYHLCSITLTLVHTTDTVSNQKGLITPSHSFYWWTVISSLSGYLPKCYLNSLPTDDQHTHSGATLTIGFNTRIIS